MMVMRSGNNNNGGIKLSINQGFDQGVKVLLLLDLVELHTMNDICLFVHYIKE